MLEKNNAALFPLALPICLVILFFKYIHIVYIYLKPTLARTYTHAARGL